jgi:PPOX class probable FMN-dependent enzyme
VTDPHRITRVEEIIEILGAPNELTPFKVLTALDDMTRDFIARSPFAVLSTADAAGNQDVSPKGDPAGFVLVESDHSIAIPDRSGNKLAFGHRNILQNPHVAVLFFVPGTPETLRINGRAELTRDPALLERLHARGKPPLLAIRVAIDEVFYHCPKAFMRSELWKPETWPERQRISMGKVLERRLGKDTEFASGVDARIEKSRQDL